MFYVSPQIQPQFNSLSTDLQNVIKEKDVKLNTLTDLINVLETITKESEG